ncbi:MAG: aldo/keto reductase [Clostridium sp.]|nr:aldo/keto reductase [Clostridium sp.]
MSKIPMWTLNNGIEIPSVGFGVFRIEDGGDVYDAVLHAIKSGYRLIDTAAIYGNEEGVGRAIKDSGVKREDLFITTKLWNSDQGYDKAFDAFDLSLKKLGLDYVDLYLIHWPGPDNNLFVDSWKALEKLYKDKRTRAIGVCNFHVHHLKHLLANSTIAPVLNQIELHPLMNQKEIRDYCAEQNILVEAWGPLMQGKKDLDAPLFVELGKKYGKTPAQVILKWHQQNEVLAIPKSETPSRIEENIDIFDFAISPDDMERIDAYNKDERLASNPDTLTSGF